MATFAPSYVAPGIFGPPEGINNLSVKGDRVAVGTFEMVSNPTIKWADLKFVKYDILGRVGRKLTDMYEAREYAPSEIVDIEREY